MKPLKVTLASCSLSHFCYLPTFPDVFVAIEISCFFLQEVAPSPSVNVATRTGVLSQTAMFFPDPNQVVCGSKPNQSISTMLAQKREST